MTEEFDVAKAALLVFKATFAHSGQVCMATKRIYVQEKIYDEFMKHLVAAVKELRPGEGMCSPIQNKMQYDKIRSIYADCKKNGYTFAFGNGCVPEHKPGTGYFVSPAIISNPPEKSRIVLEEPFGPIIPVLSFNTDEEVIKRVNESEVGLGATVYCRDEKRAWDISSSIEAGSIWVNGGLKMHPEALFGAHKQSGIGGELGPLGLMYYTSTRTITFWKTNFGDDGNEGGLFT